MLFCKTTSLPRGARPTIGAHIPSPKIKNRILFGYALCLHYLCKAMTPCRKNGKETEGHTVFNGIINNDVE